LQGVEFFTIAPGSHLTQRVTVYRSPARYSSVLLMSSPAPSDAGFSRGSHRPHASQPAADRFQDGSPQRYLPFSRRRCCP